MAECIHCLYEDVTTKLRPDMSNKFMCNMCYDTQKKVQSSDEPAPDSGMGTQD